MRIGEFIKYKRKSMGYSQVQFAELLGISKQAVNKWESDAALPNLMVIPTLAQILMVKPEFLVNAIWLGASGNPITHFVQISTQKKRGKPYLIKVYESEDYTTAQELYDLIRQGKHPDTTKLLLDYYHNDPSKTFTLTFIETTIASIEDERAEFPIDTLWIESCKLDSVIASLTQES